MARTFIFTFLPIIITIVLYIHIPGADSLSILPEYEKRPDGIVKLRDARRNLELSEPITRQVVDFMMSKNFSLLIDFTLEEQTRGTLFSVYAGAHKVFELYAEGLRGELRIHWRRHSSLANLHIKHLLDDNRWHTVLLSMQRSRLRLLIDCEEAVAGDYPEIDFSLLNTSKPQIWIGQRNKAQSFFQGSFRRFDIESTNQLVRRNCGRGIVLPPSPAVVQTSSQFPRDQPTPAPGGSGAQSSTPAGGARPSSQPNVIITRDTPSLEELKTKVNSLENVFNRILNNVFGSSKSVTATPNEDTVGQERQNQTTGEPMDDFSTPVPPRMVTDGVCPNCYEYLRYKINHLEDELKNWREQVRKLDKNVQRVMLAQRGCQINTSTTVQDGATWMNTENCTECVCSMNRIVCKPIGCAPLPPSCAGQRPHLRPGQCCPSSEHCPRQCTYSGHTYEHGRTFWPKECVRCQCVDGETSCAYRTDECPRLTCPPERQYKHENHCCPVCEHDDFCATHPCHSNATCTNRKADRECKCKPGFFGDGEQCFDVDECRWDPTVAEQLGGCGTGSRCINTPGSFYCECLPGYAKLNERACLDMIIL
jgi:hypothetical protein